MVQTGINQKNKRTFEDYASLHKFLNGTKGSDKVNEWKTQLLVATGGAGAQIEVREVSGETIADAPTAGEIWVLASDTDDVLYDGESVTLVYMNTSGVEVTTTAVYNVANSTTEQAFVPAVVNAVYPISAVSSVAVQAGDNVYIGVTGVVAGADDRRVTILAGATEPIEAGLVGVGSVEIVQKTDQVGTDGGKLVSFEYVTVWGEIKNATIALSAAATTTAVLPIITGTTSTVKDFYRCHEATFAMLATDELFIQRLTVLGAAAIRCVIKAANYAFVDSRFGASKQSYLGNIRASLPTVGELLTIEITYTPYGETLAQILTYDIFGTDTIEIAERLAVGTDVKVLINDGAVAGANANMVVRYLEVVS